MKLNKSECAISKCTWLISRFEELHVCMPAFLQVWTSASLHFCKSALLQNCRWCAIPQICLSTWKWHILTWPLLPTDRVPLSLFSPCFLLAPSGPACPAIPSHPSLPRVPKQLVCMLGVMVELIVTFTVEYQLGEEVNLNCHIQKL